MPDLVAIGELLVDFTYINTPDGSMYKENAGGAPANVVCMASKLGGSTGFIGKIGNDQLGSLFSGSGNIVGFILALVVLACFCWALFRKPKAVK